VLVCIIVW